MAEQTEQFVTLAVQQDGPARTETFQGRPHRVIPAVLVQSQVLHNNIGRSFLPADEITNEWAETFNGAPVLVDHPKERGAPVAARNNRRVLDSMGIGFIDNARAEQTKVKAEVWLDEGRSPAVPELDAILARLDAGQRNELSTGFPLRSVEATQGAHGGRDYDVVLRPGPGDHLAVFAQKRGACSVTDGCGLGVNHEGGCQVEDEISITADESADAITLLEKVVAAARRLVKNGGEAPPNEPPETSEPEPTGVTTPEEGNTMNREQMIAHLAEKGRNTEVLNALSDCDLKALMGADSGTPPESRSEEDRMWQQKALNYRRELDELKAKSKNALQEEADERVDLLDDLLYKGRSVAWGENELKAMDIVQLRKVHRQVFNVADYSGRGGPRATTAPAGNFDWVKPMNVVLAEKETN